MQNYITLYFKGKAVSKDNEKLISKYPAKSTGKYFNVLSTYYKIYEKGLRKQALKQLPKNFKPYEGNVWVSLIFYFKNRVHCDLPNLPKSVCDAMEGILYKNDKQVWLKQVRPYYNKNNDEGFTMIVEPVEEKCDK